jgi:hypothetical protein
MHSVSLPSRLITGVGIHSAVTIKPYKLFGKYSNISTCKNDDTNGVGYEFGFRFEDLVIVRQNAIELDRTILHCTLGQVFLFFGLNESQNKSVHLISREHVNENTLKKKRTKRRIDFSDDLKLALALKN